jgi:hypothetical protein
MKRVVELIRYPLFFALFFSLFVTISFEYVYKVKKVKEKNLFLKKKHYICHDNTKKDI